MAIEFRLIGTRACDISDYESLAVIGEGLPGQLVEILPRPALKPGETEEQWSDLYLCNVYFDDGVRFTHGIIPREATVFLNADIDAESFAFRCMRAADEVAVPADTLLAIADLLTGIKNVPPVEKKGAGPFLYHEKSWSDFIKNRPALGFSMLDRLDPNAQTVATAAEMDELQQACAAAGVRAPSAADHAFVRLFGRGGAEALIGLARANPQDATIDDVLKSLRLGLDNAVSEEELRSQIGGLSPAWAIAIGAGRKTSEVLQALKSALAAPLERAQGLIGALRPQMPPPPPPPPQPGAAPDLALGPNARYREAILAAANKCGMDPAGLAALIDAEAAKVDGVWDPNSRNPTSTARGLTQFLKGSWLDLASRPWSTLNKVAKDNELVGPDNRVTNPNELLDLRADPALSIMSAAEYAASNLKFVMGKSPPYRDFYDPSTPDGKMRLAYLCHHEGAGGALTYLRGGKDQRYVDWLDSYIARTIVPSRFRSGEPQIVNRPLIVVTDDVLANPKVAFAEINHEFDQCFWPVVTDNGQALVVCHRRRDRSVVGWPSRTFLADRQGGRRYHVGIDLFCGHGDKVVAIADGTIVKFYPFYEGTNALLIDHDGVVINYGEVAPGSDREFGWQQGHRVTAGQMIARVGRLNMIHLEAYRPGTQANARWMQNGEAPPAVLRSPTRLLLGLAARARRLR
jgi:murein DD-endopeptidase MepM/ murein hydrolase activator NlpD